MNKVNVFYLKLLESSYSQIQRLIITQSIKNESYDTVHIKSTR